MQLGFMLQRHTAASLLMHACSRAAGLDGDAEVPEHPILHIVSALNIIKSLSSVNLVALMLDQAVVMSFKRL